MFISFCRKRKLNLLISLFWFYHEFADAHDQNWSFSTRISDSSKYYFIKDRASLPSFDEQISYLELRVSNRLVHTTVHYVIKYHWIICSIICVYTIYILNRSGIFACTLRRFTLRRYSAQLCYVWNRVTSNLRNGSSKIRQPREFVGKPYGVCSYPNIQQRKIPRGEEIVS